MKLTLFYLTMINIIFFSSCNGIFQQKVIGNYFLVAMDNDKDRTTLSYKIDKDDDFVGVIDEMVYAVGFNNNFIIAKQHPSNFSLKSNQLITNYYIVVLANRNSFSGKKNVYAPFNELEFIQKKRDLNIPKSLDFSKFIN